MVGIVVGSRRVGRARSVLVGKQRLDPHLHAEDGLYACLGTGLGQADGAVEAVVVGEGDGRLAQSGGSLDQSLDAAAAVEEGEVGMDVEVDEGEAALAIRGITRSFRPTFLGPLAAQLPGVVMAGWQTLHFERVEACV